MPLSFAPNLPLHAPPAPPGRPSICRRTPPPPAKRVSPSKSRRRAPPTASDAGGADEPVLEGDLLLFRDRAPSAADAGPAWGVAACTGSFGDSVQLCPVYARSVDDRGNWELFVEEEHLFGLDFRPLSALQVRFIDADYEMRVIEDRIINPHGEESEHCWRVDPAVISALPVAVPPPPSRPDS